jgi:hypothetical protein
MRPFNTERNPEMPENIENPVPADLPAEKPKKIRNPFAKKNVPADANEPAAKKQQLHGVYAMGALLLVAGAVVAIASKLGQDDEDETPESDTTEAA